jgi:hypothetical protein
MSVQSLEPPLAGEGRERRPFWRRLKPSGATAAELETLWGTLALLEVLVQ